MYLKKNKGLTLIELLITMAVLGILMAAIASFVFPTMTFYAKTQNTANAKNAANLMMDYIEGSVYSTNDITLGAKTTNISGVDTTIYGLTADENKGLTSFKGKGSSSDVYNTGITAGLRFDITFSKKATLAKVLCVEIKVKNAQSGEDLYGLKKDIYLGNLLQAAPKDDIQNDGSAAPYREIRFTKPIIVTP